MFQFSLSPYFSIPCENQDCIVLYIDEVILQRTGATDYYFTHDYRYSVTSLTNASGNIVESYDYKVYGERTASGSGLTDVGYTGQRHDSETGLMYFKNRYYSVSMGSFVTRDPLGYVDGMSMYLGYFGGDSRDPFGYDDTEIQKKQAEIDAVKVPNLGKAHSLAGFNYNSTIMHLKYVCKNDKKEKDKILDRIYGLLETFSELNGGENKVTSINNIQKTSDTDGIIEFNNLSFIVKTTSEPIGDNDEPFSVSYHKTPKNRTITVVTNNKHPLVGIRKFSVEGIFSAKNELLVIVKTEAWEQKRNIIGSMASNGGVIRLGVKQLLPIVGDKLVPNPDKIPEELWKGYFLNIANAEKPNGGSLFKGPDWYQDENAKTTDKKNPFTEQWMLDLQKSQTDIRDKLTLELEELKGQ